MTQEKTKKPTEREQELEEQVRVLSSRVLYLQRVLSGARTQLGGLYEMLAAGDAEPRK